MRILHFYKTYYPETFGGAEQVINQLARASAKLGVENEVLSLGPKKGSNTIEIDGHLVHRVSRSFQIASTGFSVDAFSRFKQLSQTADLIHYHFPWPFMDLVHFISSCKKPSIVTYHSDIIRQKILLKLYRPLKHRFLNSVDRIVATSPHYFETSEVLNQYRNKTVIIPIGLDKATYPKVSSELLNSWRSKVGDRFFLFVGMLRYYKGLHILLEAMKGTPYPVVIVGSGPNENELKAQMRQLNLTKLYFTGSIPDEDKVALFTLCSAVIFPSHLRSEAFGISLLEGAMYGKPLISTEIGTGTSYINIHNQTGLVVKPADPLDLRNAMGHLWDNPKLAEKMGQEAEKRYLSLFSAEHMATRYLKLYQEVLASVPDERPALDEVEPIL